jgi:hypothetical protein
MQRTQDKIRSSEVKDTLRCEDETNTKLMLRFMIANFRYEIDDEKRKTTERDEKFYMFISRCCNFQLCLALATKSVRFLNAIVTIRVVVGLNKTRRGCPNPIHWWGWTPYFVQWVELGWWACPTLKLNSQSRRSPPIWKKRGCEIIF